MYSQEMQRQGLEAERERNAPHGAAAAAAAPSSSMPASVPISVPGASIRLPAAEHRFGLAELRAGSAARAFRTLGQIPDDQQYCEEDLADAQVHAMGLGDAMRASERLLAPLSAGDDPRARAAAVRPAAATKATPGRRRELNRPRQAASTVFMDLIRSSPTTGCG